MSDHDLFLGSDGVTEFLLTVFDDGTKTLVTRPVNEAAGWSPPAELAQVPIEVCS